jgi:two-component system, chemotaxis family, protein-glutamate methylesterase/glutaminase
MSSRSIRVLLVEDSVIALTILKRMLSSSPDIQVVGTAETGKRALAILNQVQPDVICTDLHMPEMNGLELIREVMATDPKPILVVSAAVQEEDSDNVFQLLQAGAVDIFPKPRAGLNADYELAKQELITKIKVLSGVKVFTQHRRVVTTLPNHSSTSVNNLVNIAADSSIKKTDGNFNFTAEIKSDILRKIVVIGASTGGPQAFDTILTQLPANFPAPIVCIQHISEGFLQGLVDWLNAKCKLPVTIAQHGNFPQPGYIYFAPEQKHLEIDNQGRFYYSNAAPLNGHRPAITVTFNSVAKFYKRSVMAILLTGMGRDGADGMHSIYQQGGLTIAQDEASSVVFGMPKEAIALHCTQFILPLNTIANKILTNFNLS